MKKDDMLDKIIEMTTELTRLKMEERVNLAEDQVKEMQNLISEYIKRDNRQLEKMIEQQDEINDLKRNLKLVSSDELLEST